MSKEMIKYQKILWILLRVDLVLLVVHFMLICTLPNLTPLHWNNDGTADIYGSKWWYLLADLIPFVSLWLFYLPFKASVQPSYLSTRAWKYFAITFNSMMTIATWIPEYILFTEADARQSAVEKSQSVVMLILGIMFVILGNFMPQVGLNHMFGVKTPWTKSDVLNWKKTNHLFSILIFIVGIMCVIGALFYSLWIRYLGVAGIILTIILYCYSFYLHCCQKK